MTRPACEATRDLLVDYADGELPDESSQAVRRHLVDCPLCCDELSRLQRSLEHARAIWQRSSAIAEGTSVSLRPVKTSYATVVAGSAVCAITILSLVVALNWDRGRAEIPGARPRQVVQSDKPVAEQEAAEIEDLIAWQARSARLAASSELLAAEPSLAEYRRQADRYLATTFERLPAGQQAKQRLRQSNSDFKTGTDP